MMKLKIMAVLAGMCSLASFAEHRPDVLFIAMDDMNDWNTLFDAGNPIQAPNLQRLASRGCFFTQAYCVTPACNPSRTAILSGLRPTTSGVYGNRQSWKKLIPDAVMLPRYFKENGYITKGAGKIFHHGSNGADNKENPSFDDFQGLKNPKRPFKENLNGYTKEYNKHLSSGSFDWGAMDVDKHTDENTVDYVSAVMKEARAEDQPLFLAAGIFRPHLPFYAPSSTFARYPFEELRMPPMPENDLDDVPAIGREMAHTQEFVWENATKPPVDRPGSLKKMVQSYQAAADFADEMVGRLLDELDASGRADNTIIVLWSDHGYHLGDKESCMKFTLWEKANHVPFIIVAPGIAKPGTKCDQPVSLLDIYPTLVELAGLPEKEGLDGSSLVPLLKNPETNWEKPAVSTLGRGNHSIRSKRWRYIHYNDGTEELYDHDGDPWEWTNLAENPEYAAVLEEHRKWLPKNEAPFNETGRGAWVYGSWD